MNIPNIPDNFHKFLILIGAIALIYSFYQNDSNIKMYNTRLEYFDKASDSISILGLEEKLRLEEIISRSNTLALKGNLKKPFIKNNDSTYTYIEFVGGSKLQESLGDSIKMSLDKYNQDHLQLIIQNEKLKIIARNLNKSANFILSERKYNNLFFFLGFLFILSGYISWNNLQKIKDNLLRWELIEKGEIFDHCQSCGKNFSAVRNFGSEIDGKINYSFCLDCYKDGSFIHEKTDEYFSEIKRIALSSSRNWIKKIKIRRRYSNLVRWKINDY